MMLRRMMMAAAASGGTTPVPDYSNVKWLLNMSGASGSTSFPDSTGKRTWAAHGDVKVDTSQGYNAALFDGSGDYLDTTHSSDLVLGAQDFCIEGFVYLPNAVPQQALIEKRGTGFAAGDWVVFITNSAVEIYSYDVDPAGNRILFANSAFPSNTLTHWAWTRTGNTMRFFSNGVLVASRSTSASIASSAAPLSIGRDNVSGGRFWLNGRMRACRGTIGEAVYTSNFTPPNAPYPES